MNCSLSAFLALPRFRLVTIAAASALSAATLIGCGGGGSADTQSSSSPALTGVVAIGAALPSATVTVTDAKGVKVSATTSSSGYYEIADPAGVRLTAPFSVAVNTQLGTTEVALSSLALSRGDTANVTPFSTATLALMNASNNYNAAALSPASVTAAAIADSTKKLADAIAPLLQASGVTPEKFNPLTGSFQANREGVDSVMDSVAVDVNASGVTLINRFTPVGETSGAPGNNRVSITAAGPSASLAVAAAPSALMVADFEKKLKKCFSVPASQRVAYTTNPVGRQIATPNSVHADCLAFVHTAFRSQGQPFGQSWLWLLANEDIDGSVQFALVPQYVVDRTGAARWQGTDDNLAYVYNINLIDRNGLTYTRVEVLAKINNALVVRGNQRAFDVLVGPQFTKVNDNVGKNNYVEGRLRISIDPHLVPPAGPDSESTYATYQMSADGSKPQPKIMCAWVTGPLLQNDEIHDPLNPRGGVLMVPPHSDLTARRDYSAIRIKYPKDFDPKGNPAHRAQLLKDCREYPHNAGTSDVQSWQIGSHETNNAFTIDGAKFGSDSETVFNAYPFLTTPTEFGSIAYPTSLPTSLSASQSHGRTSCPSQPGGATSPVIAGVTVDRSKISGWCGSTKRENLVDPSLRARFEQRYTDPKDVIYTFYLFVDRDYLAESGVSTSAASKTAYSTFSVSTANKTAQQIEDEWKANGDRFFDTAYIIQARTVGALPFVDKDSGGLYAGNQVFRGIGQAMIDAYLKKPASGSDLATLAKNSSIQGSWVIPPGVEGIDRLGIGGWFRRADGSRIGAASFGDSFGLPRSGTSKSFTLTEDWYGFDAKTYNGGQFASVTASTYREIWVWSYDSKNRRIQTVENALR